MMKYLFSAVTLFLGMSLIALAGPRDSNNRASEFLDVVGRGNEARALMLLSNGYHFDEETGRKAFELAVEADLVVFAKRLLKLGVNADVDQALIIAAGNGNEKMVDMLLDQNADLNTVRNNKLWGSHNPGSYYPEMEITAAEMATIRAVNSNQPFVRQRFSRIASKLYQRGAEVRNPYNLEFDKAFFRIWGNQRNEPQLYDLLVDAIPSDFYTTVLSDTYDWKFNHNKRPQREARARKIQLRFRRALADIQPVAHEIRKARYAKVSCILEKNQMPLEVRRIVGRYSDVLPVLVGENPVFRSRSKLSE